MAPKDKDKKTTTAESTELATKGETALAAYDYGEDEHDGYEGQSSADTSIPFVNILQAQSPQCMDGKQERIPEAKAGQFHHPLTKRLYDGKKGILIIPVTSRQVYAEFKPRDQGGGFQGLHDPEDPKIKKILAEGKFGEYKIGGNDLVDTRYLYALLVDEEDQETTPQPVVLGLKSAAIKPFRNWNTVIRGFEIPIRDGDGNLVRRQKPPMYAHRTRVTTELKTNSEGSWYNPVFTPANGEPRSSLLDPRSDLYAAAKAFKDLIDTSAVKVNHDTMDRGGGGEGTAEKADASF